MQANSSAAVCLSQEGLEGALLERIDLPWGGKHERQDTAENARSRLNGDDEAGRAGGPRERKQNSGAVVK